MLKGNNKRLTKEEELELGKIVQIGIKAESTLNSEDNLTDKQLIDLNKQISEGEAARQELVETHIGFANKLAVNFHKQTGTKYSLEDLAADAYLALYASTQTYDPAMDCVLSTYAYYKITKALSVKINKMRAVRLPENRMGDYAQIIKAENSFIQDKNGLIDPGEMLDYVVEQTGLTKETISMIKTAIMGTISLNVPIGEGNNEFGDLIKDEKKYSNEIENPLLADIVGNLSTKEQNILALELGVGISTIGRSEFLKKYEMTEVELEKQAKKIVRALRKKALTQGGGSI